MNAEIAPQLSYSEHERLHIAYNNVEHRYNDFLTIVKADLSDMKAIKKMTRDPQGFAEGYADEYKKVVYAFESEYMPVYNDVKNKKRFITPTLVAVGIELVTQIVNWITKRQEMRDEQVNVILGIVNKYFYDELRMKSWTELGLKPAPNAAEGTTAADAVANQTVTADMGKKGKNDAVTVPASVQNPVQVPAATFHELNGFVEFTFLKDDKTPTTMPFVASKTRDITIGYLAKQPTNTTDPVVVNTTTAKTAFYTSTEAYGAGGHFQLKVNNTGGMYIFALNTGNKALCLYPYENRTIPDCSPGKRSMMRDITIGELPTTPVVNKDMDGNITLPTADCATSPPTERYFAISGPVNDEQFCVLLSKSELNVVDIAARIQAESGTFAERLARIFGTQAISPADANLALQDNRLTFDARTATQNVLPVVFVIKRK
jgi:hypothetical protein